MEIVSLFGSTIRETLNAFKIKEWLWSTSSSEGVPLKGLKRLKAEESEVFSSSKLKELLELAENISSTNDSKIAQSIKKKSRSSTTVNLTRNDIFENRLKAIMRIVVTLILLGISIFLLVTCTSESKTIPCSIISAVTGYWLK